MIYEIVFQIFVKTINHHWWLNEDLMLKPHLITNGYRILHVTLDELDDLWMIVELVELGHLKSGLLAIVGNLGLLIELKISTVSHEEFHACDTSSLAGAEENGTVEVVAKGKIDTRVKKKRLQPSVKMSTEHPSMNGCTMPSVPVDVDVRKTENILDKLSTGSGYRVCVANCS